MLNSNSNNCFIEGCLKPANYQAKKSPKNIDETISLCLEHIRLHNNNWNFFQDMHQEEIMKYQESSVYFDQPTWKFGVKRHFNESDIHNKVKDYLGMKKPKTHVKADYICNLPEPENKSLKELGLTYPVDKTEVKKAYRNLVKLYHPDYNPKAALKFISIKNAYDILMNSALIIQ